MPTVKLLEKTLPDIATAHGTVYNTLIGDVSYTKLVEPKGFVLQAKDQQLRFYLFKPKGSNMAEHVWGLSSIIKEGLPISEGLMQYKVKQGFKAGLKLLDDPEKFAAEILNGYAVDGTAVHQGMEDLLNKKKVTIAGANTKQQWGIMSGAHFINDFQIRNPRTEQIVAHDKVIDGVRVVYAGTVDLICEIYAVVSKQWETWLIDYKTSKEAHLSHRVQTQGYAIAAEQSLGIKIDRCGVLLLGKQTKKGYQLIEVGTEKRIPITEATVIAVYKMALLVNEGKLPEPSFKVFPTVIQLEQEKEEANGTNS